MFQDSTYTDKPIIDFDFPSLDLDQSVFTSEDHAEILMQADDLLHAAKCQLLNMQLGMTFEEKRFEAERQSSTSLYMRLVDLCYKVSKYTECKL